MEARPEKIHHITTAETWFLAHDLVDFRRRLILGDPENGWSQQEAEHANLDVYKRFDPVKGWVWAIYRFKDGTHMRVGTTRTVPGVDLLRNLAHNSVRNGHDWMAEWRALNEARVAEGRRALAEAQEEVADMVAHAEAGKRVW